ncbi:hypothetical protein BH11MYX2_BH11MYX2_17750 [soil metagenome]
MAVADSRSAPRTADVGVYELKIPSDGFAGYAYATNKSRLPRCSTGVLATTRKKFSDISVSYGTTTLVNNAEWLAIPTHDGVLLRPKEPVDRNLRIDLVISNDGAVAVAVVQFAVLEKSGAAKCGNSVLAHGTFSKGTKP